VFIFLGLLNFAVFSAQMVVLNSAQQQLLGRFDKNRRDSMRFAIFRKIHLMLLIFLGIGLFYGI
jgi:hypothetical protein